MGGQRRYEDARRPSETDLALLHDDAALACAVLLSHLHGVLVPDYLERALVAAYGRNRGPKSRLPVSMVGRLDARMPEWRGLSEGFRRLGGIVREVIEERAKQKSEGGLVGGEGVAEERA